jgi:FlaA1/EpsC-like NDP-sugar epimerase
MTPSSTAEAPRKETAASTLAAAKVQSQRREVLIVGSGPRAYKIFRDLQADPESPYQLIGFVDSVGAE